MTTPRINWSGNGHGGPVVAVLPDPGLPALTEPSEEAADLKQTQRVRRPSAAAPVVDRLPPHSPEAEVGVLGCVLLSPNECMGECIEKFKGGAEVFYDLRHKTIYNTLAEMHEKREAIDVITLQQRLKDQRHLEEVGGIPYLASLPDAVPSAANLIYYLDIVQEKYLLRRMIHTCTDVLGRVYDYEGEVDDLLDDFEKQALAVRQLRAAAKQETIKDTVRDALAHIEDVFVRRGKISGISTGFRDLDRETDGLHGSELIVVGAPYSTGKTALCMNIAVHVLLESQLPVAVFSLEMSARQLVVRSLMELAKLNMRRVRFGQMHDSDFPRLAAAAAKLAESRMFIDDRSDLSIDEIRASARRLHQQHGVKLFVVDYIQLVGVRSGRKGGSREEEVSRCGNSLKQMSKELDVTVLAPSQLNKDGDTRESSALEQHADGVWKLNDHLNIKDGDVPPDAYPVEVLLQKQRYGARGRRVTLTFIAEFTRFEDAARISDEDAQRAVQPNE